MSSMENCGTAVQTVLRGVPGVTSVDLNFDSKSAEVLGDADIYTMIEVIKAAGFHATLANKEAAADDVTQNIYDIMW